ncbi:sensor histidine kinase [Mucilaginibacter gotjawali]|uniref:histidine kinase n=1 Tax=Mucilaginibacter gotjawali TaxID=1550579 RepID=A0A839SBW8_9SPHI|nr:HAMP domain-containing sensor histidine kinase [Mucilaginibacter gotjawali]MBB3054812.1 hypothetical protein [Mucilaginibacter gotjawali]
MHIFDAFIGKSNKAKMINKGNKPLPGTHLVCDSLCHSGNNAGLHTNASLFNQVKDFFTKILSTSDWPARWHCGTWSDFHGWLYILSDLSIWAAYFAIPVLLYRIVHKRRDLPFLKIFWLFIAFILLCGTTHLLDAMIFWWPAYRLSALIKLATGLVSIVTVFALYKIVPLINNLRTLAQLEAQIDERKKAEQEARHQQVLKQATEELMAKKDEFMSIASHELKTPITSVKASLQLLQRMAAKDEALQQTLPFVNKAAKQVDKLTDIIHDLLDVTRIQAGKLELNRTEFNLADLVKECVEQCEPERYDKKIKITGDEQILVNADRNRIEQVIINLLTNALKYSPKDDKITISIERQDNSLVKVSVKDNGIGIPGDKIENIFDRFYRVENNSPHLSGLGLGLYISSEIIKRHGREIGVESAPGKGSDFWFTL